MSPHPYVPCPTGSFNPKAVFFHPLQQSYLILCVYPRQSINHLLYNWFSAFHAPLTVHLTPPYIHTRQSSRTLFSFLFFAYTLILSPLFSFSYTMKTSSHPIWWYIQFLTSSLTTQFSQSIVKYNSHSTLHVFIPIKSADSPCIYIITSDISSQKGIQWNLFYSAFC